jgi:hypothetical protein
MTAHGRTEYERIPEDQRCKMQITVRDLESRSLMCELLQPSVTVLEKSNKPNHQI